MSADESRLQIIVDPSDDIATVRAVQALPSSRKHLLVVAITPTATSTSGLAWDILRALGKRREQRTPLARHNASLMAARRWLAAHRIEHLAVLYAQNIGAAVIAELKHALAEDKIRLSLIYTNGHAGVRPTHTLEDLLSGAEEHGRPGGRVRWPNLPGVHALRFRYECRWALSTDDFAQVDALLQDTYGRFGKWLSGHPRANQHELGRAVSIVLACRDQNQLTIRSKAAELALMSARRSGTAAPIDSTVVVRRHLREDQAGELLRHLDPLVATREAVSYATGLPDDLQRLIGRDQISAYEFLGTEPPAELMPLLRALDLNGGWRHVGRPPTHTAGAPSGPRPSGDVETVQALLHELLHTERKRVRLSLIHSDLHAEVLRLCRDDILLIADNYCLATDVARYGVYQIYDAPLRRGPQRRKTLTET